GRIESLKSSEGSSVGELSCDDYWRCSMADQQNSDASRNVQTQNGKPRSSGKRLEILRHPLVLLIIGATITSLLFPYLNSRVNRNELLQEAKLKKASEI